MTPTWLSLTPSPAEGVNAGSFTVNVTRSDLTPGVHTGTITISDPHAVNHPYVIPVSYRIYEPRKISIGIDTLRIKVSYKRVSVAANIPVINGGESFGPGEISWTASSTNTWMSLFNASGLEGDKLGINISALTLMPGTYHGEIVIEGENSVTGAPIVNSPLTIPVLLENEPRDQVVHTVGSLPMGSGMSFYNAQGHIIARIDVSSGSVQGLTLRLMPYGLPRNIQRLRYAYRHYIMEATGTYTADMTLYYTLSELGQCGIDQPELLRIWRQIPAQYIWVPYAGYASPLMQSVSAYGVTDLNGIWGMAYPYFPQNWETEINAAWKNDNEARLQWTTTLETSGIGFIVERSTLGRDDWRTVGVVTPSETGFYQYDEALARGAYAYRLLTFDREGNALQSQEVELQPNGILSAGEIAGTGFALGSAAPNPVPLQRASTLVQYRLDRAGSVRLTLHDATGRELRVITDAHLSAGNHNVDIPVAGLAAGRYFYRLVTEQGSQTRPLIVLP